MIVRKEFEFPMPDANDIKQVEAKVLELQVKYRNGEQLNGPELDYLDFANNVLDTLS
ncbi:hypothetical protein [Caulobacter phage Cr30]|uniref:hypothetical protein n=1 Tax=Caulobacter phage Cr30 TaxID=1357714 RepID=UPI0004A9B588|nr:hypothetical protein OZ74_gp028 [Caulobacter phage Cr30]AGS80913.1 hypothetical protein [Caulobacter phage Cr30]